jgi:hypothetical protein
VFHPVDLLEVYEGQKDLPMPVVMTYEYRAKLLGSRLWPVMASAIALFTNKKATVA